MPTGKEIREAIERALKKDDREDSKQHPLGIIKDRQAERRWKESQEEKGKKSQEQINQEEINKKKAPSTGNEQIPLMALPDSATVEAPVHNKTVENTPTPANTTISIQNKKNPVAVIAAAMSHAAVVSEILKTEASGTIYKTFEKAYGRGPITINNQTFLSFDNQKQADTFFKAQAKESQPFLAAITQDGKSTGQFHYSCGDGTLYTGNIKDISVQLEKANKNEKDPNMVELRKAGMHELSKHQSKPEPTPPSEGYSRQSP